MQGENNTHTTYVPEHSGRPIWALVTLGQIEGTQEVHCVRLAAVDDVVEMGVMEHRRHFRLFVLSLTIRHNGLAVWHSTGAGGNI